MPANIVQRRNVQPTRIPEVETVRCDKAPGGGNHELSADRWARVACVHCGAGWAAIDAVVREAAQRVERKGGRRR